MVLCCCCAKDAVVEQPEELDDTSPDDPVASPEAEAPSPKVKAKKKVPASTKKKEKAKNSGGSSQPAAKPSAPAAPAGAIPIEKGEAPPPGWGGTPEVEEIELELDEQRQTGPRALKNIPGGNGYISGTRKDQEISEGVMDRIRGLEEAGLQTKKKMGLKMLTPRIITDVKEVWDEEGNITRYMTHYIEEPDGTKHTKKETMHIAAGEPDPMAPPEAE